MHVNNITAFSPCPWDFDVLRDLSFEAFSSCGVASDCLLNRSVVGGSSFSLSQERREDRRREGKESNQSDRKEEVWTTSREEME